MDFLIVNSNIASFKNIIFEVILSVIIGIIINLIYRKTYKGVSLSYNFSNTLTGLTIVSYFIIRCITNNTLLSLGMVGALSIVRFRNSVKDSSDIMFAFWAIAEGIIIGAQEYLLGLIFVLAMSIFVIIFYGLNRSHSQKMILIIKYTSDITFETLQNILKENFPKYHLKEQRSAATNELIVEVKYDNKKLIDLNKIKVNGITEISMVDYVEPLL